MEQIAFDWRRCLEDVTAAAPDRLVISSIRSIRFASVFHPAATDPSHRIQFEKPLANWFRKFRLQFSAKTQTRPSIGKLRQNWTALPDRLQKIFHNEQNRPKIPKFENVNSDNKKKIMINNNIKKKKETDEAKRIESNMGWNFRNEWTIGGLKVSWRRV